MQPRRISCLGRLGISVIMFVVSMLVGGLVIIIVKWLYPAINPPLYNLLSFNQVPFTADILWGFWVVVPCLISMGFAVLVSLAFSAVLARTRKTT